jgi:hypothetical protein
MSISQLADDGKTHRLSSKTTVNIFLEKISSLWCGAKCIGVRRGSQLYVERDGAWFLDVEGALDTKRSSKSFTPTLMAMIFSSATISDKSTRNRK